MKALKDQNNFLIFEAYEIKFGKLDTYEPEVEKWGMYDEEGNIQLYAIDSGYSVVEFDPANKPEDYESNKYFFIDGQFVLNPDWTPAPPTLEEKVDINTEDIGIVAQAEVESEEALCELDTYYSEKIAELEARIKELEDAK